MRKEKTESKRWSALFAAAALIVTSMPAMAEETGTFTNGISTANGYVELEAPAVVYNDGSGAYGLETASAYAIENAGELAWFIRHFYQGDLETENVCLLDDIDLSVFTKEMNLSWTPLGYYNADGSGRSYNGYFDGNGYCLEGIVIDRFSGTMQDMVTAVSASEAAVLGTEVSEDLTAAALPGVFGYLGSGAVVEALCLKDISVTGGAEGAAVLAGRNQGTIRGCMLLDGRAGAYGEYVGVSDFCILQEGVLEASFSDMTPFTVTTEDGQTIYQKYVPGYLSNLAAAAPEGVFTVKKQASDYMLVEEAQEGVSAVDESMLAGGGAAWKMNQKYREALYQQQIGTDRYPCYIGDTDEPWMVYRITLDYADEAAADEQLYCNQVLPDSVWADGRQWQIISADGSVFDAYQGMAVTEDLVLTELVQAPAPTDPAPTDPVLTDPLPTDPVPSESSPSQPIMTAPEKLIPSYTVPEGLAGYVTYPLSSVALPYSELGTFVWQTDPNSLIPAGQEQVTLYVSFVPYDTNLYETVWDIPVTVSVLKLDMEPHTQCPDTLTVERGSSLASVALPDGWAWLVPECIPEKDGTEYTAVYIYADTSIYNEIRHAVVITLTNPVPTELPDAVLSSQNQGVNGWYLGDAILNAPEGCVISLSESFDSSTSLTIQGEGKQTISYYLKHVESGFVCPQKQIEVWIDRTAPEIGTAVNGKTYCGAQKVTFSDNIGIFAAAVNGQAVTITVPGELTIQPSAAPVQIAIADEAGNVSDITIQVNDGHTFDTGFCTVCGAADPDYRKPPVVSGTVADAALSSEGRGRDNWYRTAAVTLTAPTGYRIAAHDDFKNFGNNTSMTVSLNEGSNQISYYLLSSDDTVISTQKNVTLYLDTQAPVVRGIENAKHYCAPQRFTIEDAALDTENSVLGAAVAANPDGSFTAAAAAGQQAMVLRDLAGNTATVFYTVHDGHTFSEGVCEYCSEKDPDYVAPPTVSRDIPDAVPSAEGMGQNGWYRINTVTLSAPGGYRISLSDAVETFGDANQLELTLTEGENTFTYYLLSNDGKQISEAKTLVLNLDTTIPTVEGLEDKKVYCGPVSFRVTDDHFHLGSSFLSKSVTLQEDGSFLAVPAETQQLVVMRDLAGNAAEVSFTVNDGHRYESGVCTVCGEPDENYKPPVKINPEIPDASASTEGAGKEGWYRVNTVTLTAPEGYYIAAENDTDSFGSETELAFLLEEGENKLSYYLLSKDASEISEQKSLTVYLDTAAPVVSGIEEGKIYCEARRFTVADAALDPDASELGSAVMSQEDGSFTAVPAMGTQTVILRDKAGNETEIHFTVNNGHVFEEGICAYCGIADPDYKEPIEVSDELPDAQITAMPGAGGWYSVSQILLSAPEGFYISSSGDAEHFGTDTVLRTELTEGEHEITYYVMKKDGTAISTPKRLHIGVDVTAPVIGGAEEGKTYCEAQTLTVADATLEKVLLNGIVTALSSEGTLVVNPGSGVQTIAAVDAADNRTELHITVNNGHSYLNGVCTVCGKYDPDYTVNVDAVFQPQNLGNNGWYKGNPVLQAPEGFYISFVNDREAFGTETSITFTEEGSYTVAYYLKNRESGAVSQQKTIGLKFDKTAPVIGGLTENGTYCLPNGVTYTVTDENLSSVRMNEIPLAVTAGSKTQNYSIAAAGIFTITAADIAGNTATLSVSVRADHSWDAGVVEREAAPQQTGLRRHTCTVCGAQKTVEIPMTEGTAPTPAPSFSDINPSGTLTMPTTANQVNQILGIDDPSGVIGMVLIGLGVIMIGALIGLVVLMRRRNK